MARCRDMVHLNAAEEMGSTRNSDGHRNRKTTAIVLYLAGRWRNRRCSSCWDRMPVFKEAKDAGILIVLVDRMAAVCDDLYACFIGPDFILEGQNACKEMARLNNKGNKLNSRNRRDRRHPYEGSRKLKNYPIWRSSLQTGDLHAKGRRTKPSETSGESTVST